MNEFDPLESLSRLARGWWLMVMGMLLGALLGRVAALLLPPVYVAQAGYQVSMDENIFMAEHGLTIVAPANFKDTYDAVENVAYSADVENQTVRAAAAQGIAITLDDFKQMARVERTYNDWSFSVAGSNPSRLTVLANAWIENVDQALQESYQHALAYHQLSLEMAQMSACFSTNDLPAANACAGTSYSTVADFNTALKDLSARLEQERVASRGLDYALKLRLLDLASTPTAPLRNRLPILLLGGGGLGWLLGLALALKGFSRKSRS